MLCEIEFLAVGEGSRAGDAIVVRYGEEDSFELMLVDGGTAETGDQIVKHLRDNYGDDVRLSHVVLTHSDADHASGLRKVLEEIEVVNVWLHIPWLLATEAIHLFKSKVWTDQGLTNAIKNEYDIISEIFDLAVGAGCGIYYPFEGSNIGPFTVMSPTRDVYLHLLPQFDKTPDPDQEAIEAAKMWLGKQNSTFIRKFMESLASAIQNWISESWQVERLKDGGKTSASNETSVVLYANIEEGRRLLLTGDAGVNALGWTIQYAKEIGFPLREFSFVQIPHHGSRRNVGPTVLDELIGPIQPEGTHKFTAFVSAPKDDSKHPRRIVINAFKRRGGKVLATQGVNKVHWGGFKAREGYQTAEGMELFSEVEEYD